MNQPAPPPLYQDLILLRRNQTLPYLYDVELQCLDKLRGYDALECHLVLYPYSRRIVSDHLSFYPFEEYVEDVLAHQRSAYARITSSVPKLFGLLLGAAIALIFALFKPDDLFSVESIVSVFGAYVIGKELWDDIENQLIEWSKAWRLRYREDYYQYRLEKHTTLTLYSQLAKKERYGKAALTADKMDLIKASNSETARMYFDLRDLASCADPYSHLLSIHIAPNLADELEERGFLFGVKVSLNKRSLGGARCLELFQSLNGQARGCLDEQGNWIEDAIFFRRTRIWGRLKSFCARGIWRDQRLVVREG